MGVTSMLYTYNFPSPLMAAEAAVAQQELHGVELLLGTDEM